MEIPEIIQKVFSGSKPQTTEPTRIFDNKKDTVNDAVNYLFKEYQKQGQGLEYFKSIPKGKRKLIVTELYKKSAKIASYYVIQ